MASDPDATGSDGENPLETADLISGPRLPSETHARPSPDDTTKIAGDRQASTDAVRTHEDIMKAFFENLPEKIDKIEAVSDEGPTPARRLSFRKLAFWRSESLDRTAEAAAARNVELAGSQGVQIGNANVQYNLYSGSVGTAEADFAEARRIFVRSLRDRDAFIGKFLSQALRQAEATFRLSIIFMAAGGITVLVAGAIALWHPGGSLANSVALVSALGGIVVGSSGTAFWVRSDRARKHLARQAERMQSQLVNERLFTQAIDALAGVQNPDLSDEARVKLALGLIGQQSPDMDAEHDSSPDGNARSEVVDEEFGRRKRGRRSKG